MCIIFICSKYIYTYVVTGVCTFLYICYNSIKNSFEKYEVSKPGKRMHFSDEGKKNFTNNSYRLWSFFM